MSIGRTKEQYQQEIAAFDSMIRKLVPYYDRMIDVLVSIIPFPADERFDVMDLGCGTGAVSSAIAGQFPNAEFTCVDMSENMLRMAEVKLGVPITSIQADFNTFEFPRKYDLIVSSLALHHLVTDGDKLAFYEKIFSALKPGGQFINIDVVLAANDTLQDTYHEELKSFMAEHITREELDRDWIPKYGSVDYPVSMTMHLDMMKSCGFKDIDIVYKYYKFAVYTGSK